MNLCCSESTVYVVKNNYGPKVKKLFLDLNECFAQGDAVFDELYCTVNTIDNDQKTLLSKVCFHNISIY